MDDRVPDLGDAIADHLQREGEIPPGGQAVEISYIIMAKVRVLHDDGRIVPTYRPIVSRSIEPDSYEGLAARLMDEAVKARSWG
jgi:hypothetical protein